MLDFLYLSSIFIFSLKSFLPVLLKISSSKSSFLEHHLYLLLCSCCCCEVASVMSYSVQPHRRQPTRLPCPWDSPGKNTGVSCHFLLQCMKVKSEREVAQSCLTLRDPVDCSLPGSSVHGIFQARVLEWGAIVFSSVPSSSVFIWNHFFLLFVILSPIVTFWRFLNSNFSFAFYIIFLVSSQFWSDFFWHWHYAILHLRFDLTLLYLGSVALSVI